MKRRSATSKKPKKSSKVTSGPAAWTKKEDEHLIKITSEVKHYNWRIICKHQNKKFKSKTRTPEECEQHFATLKSEEPGKSLEWTTGENCALFCSCILHEGDWDMITVSMPTRTKQATQKHLLENIKTVAKLVQDNAHKIVDTKDSTEIFKIFTCTKLLIDSLENDSLYPTVVTKSLKKFKLTKEGCLEFLGAISKESGVDTVWTSDKLSKYLQTAVDRIQNHQALAVGTVDPDSTLDGLIHERVEEPMAQLPIPAVIPHLRPLLY